MFTTEYRALVREALIEKAREDPRVESAAAVGGSAEGDGDRWSDLDLTFGVAGSARDEVLADWTGHLSARFDAVNLFDLPVLSTVYRVFLAAGGPFLHTLRRLRSCRPSIQASLRIGGRPESTNRRRVAPSRVRTGRASRCPRPLLHRPWTPVAGGALDQPRA